MALEPGGPKPRIRVTHDGGGKQMTKKSDALRSDISAIMARWIAHGMKPGDDKQLQYGDFSNIADYHTAMNKLTEAQQSFMKLPSHIRKACGNDPGQFLDMVYDPEQRHRLEELGLLDHQAPADAPAAVEPPDPEPEPPKA